MFMTGNDLAPSPWIWSVPYLAEKQAERQNGAISEMVGLTHDFIDNKGS
jgi:hypothetical protein